MKEKVISSPGRLWGFMSRFPRIPYISRAQNVPSQSVVPSIPHSQPSGFAGFPSNNRASPTVNREHDNPTSTLSRNPSRSSALSFSGHSYNTIECESITAKPQHSSPTNSNFLKHIQE